MADEHTPVLETAEQISLKQELETLWLVKMKERIQDGTASATDFATLARVLMANGWVLDPKDIPQSLKSKLTSNVSPEELEDTGILPMRKKA